jgi:hypothetical protein
MSAQMRSRTIRQRRQKPRAIGNVSFRRSMMRLSAPTPPFLTKRMWKRTKTPKSKLPHRRYRANRRQLPPTTIDAAVAVAVAAAVVAGACAKVMPLTVKHRKQAQTKRPSLPSQNNAVIAQSAIAASAAASVVAAAVAVAGACMRSTAANGWILSAPI